MTRANHDSPTRRLSRRVAYMTTNRPCTQNTDAKETSIPPTLVPLTPPFYTGNFGLGPVKTGSPTIPYLGS
jgi:hypothetical protein